MMLPLNEGAVETKTTDGTRRWIAVVVCNVELDFLKDIEVDVRVRVRVLVSVGVGVGVRWSVYQRREG
jgi:hypothetical protein